MKPLISKVKPGDILFGTRNLRAYLQTISLYRILVHNQGTRRRHNGRYSGPKLYVPGKQDKFVVAANTSECFAAWCDNQNVVLLFVNPSQTDTLGEEAAPGLNPMSTQHAPVFSNPAIHRGMEKRALSKPALRMSPSIFSSWFLKTKFKNPDLREWPDYAYYLHACLHLDLVRRNTPITGGRGGLAFTAGNATENEFMLSEWNKAGGKRAGTREIADHLRVRGRMRENRKRTSLLSANGKGIGPQLQDIEAYRSSIKNIIRDSPSHQRIIEDYPDNSLLSIFKRFVSEMKSSDNL